MFSPRDYHSLLSYPGLADRLSEAAVVLREGVEPYFFLRERSQREGDSTKDVSPVYCGTTQNTGDYTTGMFSFLFPGRSREELERLASGFEDGVTEGSPGFELEVGFRSIRGTAHFHPDNVLEPSVNDLIVINQWFEMADNALNKDAKRGDPYHPRMETRQLIHLIGKGTDVLDILVLRQHGAFLPERAEQLGLAIEKLIVATAVPRYVTEAGLYTPELVGACRDFLEATDALSAGEYKDRLSRFMETSQLRPIADRFRTDFRRNITVFPEYVPAVVDSVKRLGIYDVGLLKYDVRTNVLEVC